MYQGESNMKYDFSKDFVSHADDSKYQHFSNGRTANIAVCMIRAGKWLCGKNSFIYKKQKNILKQHGIELLAIDEELLYTFEGLRTVILEEEDIVGVCFEIPCSYLNERNPFEFYNISREATFRYITSYLSNRKILTYIDGARFLIYSSIENFNIGYVDFISIGFDKSLSDLNFIGTILCINNDKYISAIKNNRKLIGGYIRKYNINLKNLKNSIHKIQSVIYVNHSKLKIVVDRLQDKVEEIDFSINCLLFRLDSIKNNILINELRIKKMNYVYNQGTFQFYFDLSVNLRDFNNMLEDFEEVFLCLNCF